MKPIENLLSAFYLHLFIKGNYPFQWPGMTIFRALGKIRLREIKIDSVPVLIMEHKDKDIVIGIKLIRDRNDTSRILKIKLLCYFDNFQLFFYVF